MVLHQPLTSHAEQMTNILDYCWIAPSRDHDQECTVNTHVIHTLTETAKPFVLGGALSIIQINHTKINIPFKSFKLSTIINHCWLLLPPLRLCHIALQLHRLLAGWQPPEAHGWNQRGEPQFRMNGELMVDQLRVGCIWSYHQFRMVMN